MILPRDQVRVLNMYKKCGYTIITTNGCFELLHAGHIHYLTMAKGLGDKCIVIVLLNSDSSVRALKGDKRPLVPENDRALIVDALGCVDFVILFDEITPDILLRDIRPHLHVKGGDYCADELPEAELVRSLGGEVITIGYVKGKSTTNLIQEIVAKFGSGSNVPGTET